MYILCKRFHYISKEVVNVSKLTGWSKKGWRFLGPRLRTHSIAKERQAGNSSARALRISSSLYSMAARGIATTRTETLSYEVHQR
jgi:hypothetical protein